MARDLTAPMVTEFTAAVLSPILLTKLEFDSGDVRLWTGLGDLTFGGEVYTGFGDMGAISPIEETVRTQARGLRLTLSGIPSATISLALSEDYQERPGTLWVGVINSSFALVADPEQIFKGRMDVMKIRDSGETADIEVALENRLIDLERPKGGRYTPEDQKARFAGDLGLDFIPALLDKQIVWGQSADADVPVS